MLRRSSVGPMCISVALRFMGLHKEADMDKRMIIVAAALIMVMFTAAGAIAGPDQYCGDTAIYGGIPTDVEKNVLIFIDNSGSMSDSIPGGEYDPSVDYTDNVKHCYDSSSRSIVCAKDAVYSSAYDFFNASVNNITTSCRGANPRNLLQTTGQYNGRRLNSDGTCRRSGTGSYLLGNYINWRFGPGAPKPKIDIAKSVISKLVQSTDGIRFGLMTFHYVSGSGEGSQFLSSSFHGSTYVTTVSTMTDTFTGTYTNQEALVNTVNTLTPTGNTPLGEALFEAMRYYQGGATAFGNTIGVSGGNYTSPIQYSCQKNFVIFVTDGMSNADNNAVLRTICTNGDCDGDGVEPGNLNHSLDDVAKYLYTTDFIPDATMDGVQNVRTFTIGFGSVGADPAAVALLTRAADGNHGHGVYYEAQSESELSKALTGAVSAILEENTSFVAPVVPVSPENRTYSGSRVYMGFFKPQNGKFWFGNLKKYGIDSTNNLTDSHIPPQHATFVDKDANLVDDRDNTVMQSGVDSDGSFRSTSKSFWSGVTDGGNVEAGGVGEVLYTRAAARNIYTYLGASTALTDAANAFSTLNSGVTDTLLEVDLADRDKLINFITGLDAYDENANGNTSEKRTWILGDVLHSRPQIVSYGSYTVATDESDCTKNKTMIFVGGNDGMLHLFKDCDGSEAWAFVPPELLPVLQYLGPTGTAHTYYVDYSPTVYVYDANRDGTIDVATDRVLLFFGLKRGGGLDSAPTAGYYYALNVTDPLNPVFLWRKSNTTSGFTELGEAWSDLSIGKIKVGNQKKIAAFMGAGYDNCHEDARYGATQTYGAACVSIPTSDFGATTSSGALTAAALATSGTSTPKGRGIYIVEIATLDNNNVPDLSASGTKIWSYTYDATIAPNMVYSIPGRIKPIDRNYDNFIDTLYAGDMGGNLWRFDIYNYTNTSLWTANMIFSSNSGTDTMGRKIFFEPSGFVQEDGTVRLYFGTGDREHPLNKAVVDRMYALIDRGQTTASAINESHLVDVTDDKLQDPNATQTEINTLVSQLTSTTKYGWYIRMNVAGHEGEKVLAPALTFNQMAIYTTYAPVAVSNPDPCVTGNLGTSRAYILNYQFGTAMSNLDTSNDANAAVANLWVRSPGSSVNLTRSDREVILGTGIASGAVMVISETGETTIFVGVGGRLKTMGTTGGGATVPLYWRQNIEYQ
jgi:type IV pilus assembly protein PilY1